MPDLRCVRFLLRKAVVCFSLWLNVSVDIKISSFSLIEEERIWRSDGLCESVVSLTWGTKFIILSI